MFIGAFRGGLWGWFLGGFFMTIPVVGHVVVLGYLAAMAISAVETAVMVGGLSALGAALYSIGIPKDSVIQYEADCQFGSHGATVEAMRLLVALKNQVKAALNSKVAAQSRQR